jgi:octaprenyl-diphosphate synthase
MSAMDRIKAPISDELNHFDGYFREVMKTEIPLLNVVMNYLIRRKGKQMRPMLVFLSAKLAGKPGPSTYTAAALIEILHTATLVHDDVVDESYERRGFFSINAIWKSKVAVLLGDYLLTQGLLLAMKNKEYELLSLTTDAVKEIVEGELMQIRNVRKLKINEEEYFEIIRKKTATLIACCSACGAKSVGLSDDQVEAWKNFGEWVGIAFQIKDDLLDYQVNNLTGKPSGNDLKDKKLTLPLIHALEMASPNKRHDILHLMRSSNRRKTKFDLVMAFIHEHEGLTYAEAKMNSYASQAHSFLNSYPDSDVKAALTEFITYTITRNK